MRMEQAGLWLQPNVKQKVCASRSSHRSTEKETKHKQLGKSHDNIAQKQKLSTMITAKDIAKEEHKTLLTATRQEKNTDAKTGTKSSEEKVAAQEKEAHRKSRNKGSRRDLQHREKCNNGSITEKRPSRGRHEDRRTTVDWEANTTTENSTYGQNVGVQLWWKLDSQKSTQATNTNKREPLWQSQATADRHKTTGKVRNVISCRTRAQTNINASKNTAENAVDTGRNQTINRQLKQHNNKLWHEQTWWMRATRQTTSKCKKQ